MKRAWIRSTNWKSRSARCPTTGSANIPPWLVDRIFRNLLIDLTGNTHRTEFCIDKLYPPDAASSRLGLVELRAFEMPPHARMSLTQQLLVRALIAQFLASSLTRQKLVQWGTALHDRFMLPHFIERDFEDVLEELQRRRLSASRRNGSRRTSNFAFPPIGSITQRGIHLELRQALEPWNVLGEEASGGGTARNVDSSVERLQVKVSGHDGYALRRALQRAARAAASHGHARRVRGGRAVSRMAAAVLPAPEHPGSYSAGV